MGYILLLFNKQSSDKKKVIKLVTTRKIRNVKKKLYFPITKFQFEQKFDMCMIKILFEIKCKFKKLYKTIFEREIHTKCTSQKIMKKYF